MTLWLVQPVMVGRMGRCRWERKSDIKGPWGPKILENQPRNLELPVVGMNRDLMSMGRWDLLRMGGGPGGPTGDPVRPHESSPYNPTADPNWLPVRGVVQICTVNGETAQCSDFAANPQVPLDLWSNDRVNPRTPLTHALPGDSLGIVELHHDINNPHDLPHMCTVD